MIGLLVFKHIYILSEEGVCEPLGLRPCTSEHFTGGELFQHAFPHERSDLSHWSRRIAL
jgi:IS5 family transposase